MPATEFNTKREYEPERFSTREIFWSERLKVVLGYFEPDQFIPVHAPGSDLVVLIQRGSGTVRDGGTNNRVASGDVVVVPADADRGIRADGGERLEALLVTAPPPTDDEHQPVREGLRTNDFEPEHNQ